AQTLDRAYLRMTMGYGKVLTTLYIASTSTPPTAAQVLAYLRQGLLLGYFPGFSGRYWDNSTLYERDRGVFQQYMPLIKKVAQAGWKSVNYPTSSDPFTLIERFGNPSAGTFYITAQNTGATTSSPQFTIDRAGLGISSTATVTAQELVSNAAVAVTRSGRNLILSDSLAAREALLYRMSVSSTSPPTVIATASPSTGPTSGGTAVTISGTGFQSGLSVLIGGVSAAIKSVGPSSIVATTGPHSSGSVDIKVTNPGGQAGLLPN